MALQISTLTTQHKALLDLVTEIAGLSPERDSAAIATKLGSIGTALTAHLGLEDKELYPALRHAAEKPDAPPSLKASVRIFFDEMEGLKPAVTGFLTKWSASAISSKPVEFKVEFASIKKTLGTRITNEESKLYALYTQHCN